MKILTRDSTRETPKILLDKNNNKFEFEGKSRPENVMQFYEPIFNWLEEYSKSPNEQTYVHMNLEYFNTSSAKAILEILRILKELHDSGNDVKIIWYYHEDDEDMQEAGEDYSSMIELPFEYKVYS
ncbi:MAG: DUF1987 domain-containing protein [Bacteroidales bacterium]|nr:DUF1987 domain-containing protein [Bacteroidales bacterium]